jgi:hypothetical protein
MATKFDEQLKALRVDIKGQDHQLAWINDEEAKLLKSRGGSGEPGPMGIPAYSEDDSVNDADSTDSGTGGANSEGGSGGSSGGSGGSSGGSGTSGTSEGNEGNSGKSDPSMGSQDPGDTFGEFTDPGGFYSFDPETGEDKGPSVDQAYDAYVNDYISRDGFTSLTGLTDLDLDDLIDQKTAEDFQRQMNEMGIDVTIGWDRETGVPTIDGTWKNATDAFGVGFTSGLSPLGDFAKFAIGGTLGTFGMPGAFSPAGFLAGIVMGENKMSGFGYNQAANITKAAADAIAELTGQPNLGKSVGQTIDELNQGYADITQGIRDMRNEVKDAVAEALGYKTEAPDVGGLTQQQTKTEKEQGQIGLGSTSIDVRGGSFVEQADDIFNTPNRSTRNAYAFTG